MPTPIRPTTDRDRTMIPRTTPSVSTTSYPSREVEVVVVRSERGLTGMVNSRVSVVRRKVRVSGRACFVSGPWLRREPDRSVLEHDRAALASRRNVLRGVQLRGDLSVPLAGRRQGRGRLDLWRLRLRALMANHHRPGGPDGPRRPGRRDGGIL